ncbi:MAG: Serine/threonine-protein kinase PknD [Myxococcota bacterium]|nr:Serine/threonine-protein kinase PknD [Myxococcota bacterium]
MSELDEKLAEQLAKTQISLGSSVNFTGKDIPNLLKVLEGEKDRNARASAADILGRILGELKDIDGQLVERIRALTKQEKDLSVKTKLMMMETKLRTLKILGSNIFQAREELFKPDPIQLEKLRRAVDSLRTAFDEVKGGSGAFDATYEILRELGKGGMGKALLAHRKTDGAHVVIKVLLEQFNTHQMLVARFVREANVMAMLNHPNIVRLIEHGDNGKNYFIVMEFLEGGDLWKAFEEGKLTYPLIIRAITHILDGLAFAHQHGIIHRDLKPSNVFFDREGVAKLADFGLAKMPAGADDKLTRSGEMFGTPRYMPPEQALSAGEVDQTADLFSLGVMAYEILSCGKQPVGDFAPLGGMGRGVPAGWDPIIERCIRPRPKERWQSAAELKAAIQALGPAQ